MARNTKIGPQGLNHFGYRPPYLLSPIERTIEHHVGRSTRLSRRMHDGDLMGLAASTSCCLSSSEGSYIVVLLFDDVANLRVIVVTRSWQMITSVTSRHLWWFIYPPQGPAANVVGVVDPRRVVAVQGVTPPQVESSHTPHVDPVERASGAVQPQIHSGSPRSLFTGSGVAGNRPWGTRVSILTRWTPLPIDLVRRSGGSLPQLGPSGLRPRHSGGH